MDSKKSENDDAAVLNDSFVRILLQDVITAIDHNDTTDDQSTRRDLIRTIFVAIEGLVWIYRRSVRSAADTIEPLSPITELAFDELSYSVDEQGRINEQPRYINITTMIRLASRVAEEISPELKIDFSVSGWMDLRLALKVRNRITHPKNISDLAVSEGDIQISQSALFWILGLLDEVMTTILLASKNFLLEFAKVSEKLNNGDEKHWYCTDLFY